MTKRRGIIALALAAGLSAGAVAPATAATTTNNNSSAELDQLSSEGQAIDGSSAAEISSELGSSKGSSYDAGKDFDKLSPVLKFSVGVFAASAAFALLGMLRTLIYNVTGM